MLRATVAQQRIAYKSGDTLWNRLERNFLQTVSKQGVKRQVDSGRQANICWNVNQDLRYWLEEAPV